MIRTFVWVELEHRRARSSFSAAMAQLGFVRTVMGKVSRKPLRLPAGMYLVERSTPVEALGLTKKAARQSKVRARIFCVPARGGTRFSDLKFA